MTRVLIVLALISAATSIGCKRRSDDIQADDSQTTQWVYTAEVYGEDEDDTFDWTSSLSDVVRVEFKADGFSGSARVRIFDDTGAEVFDEEYYGESSHYRESDFSVPTVAGDWTIRIELENASGDVRVIIDRVGL